MTKVEELERFIKKYATSYYKGRAEVSDSYFDSLVEDLRELAPDSKILSTPGWGYDPDEKKVPHWYNLEIGSLSKIKENEDVIDNIFQKEDTRISAKLDGISVVSYFINGKLIQSITRGNGREGLDVTSKINAILGSESYKLNERFTGAIRGEVVMPTSSWNDKHFDEIRNDPSANPRNMTAGIMNRIEDSSDLKFLNYVVYKVLVSESREFKDIFEINDFLQNNFENVAPEISFGSFEYIGESYKSLYNKWSEVYPCDGLVFSNVNCDNLDWNEIAYKFEDECKEVIVTDITYNATRTGRIVPRVWFNPVELSGAMVQKCTGFNAQFIKDNKVGIGSKITIARSNQVIPDLQKVIVEGDPVIPEVCPNCGAPLIWKGVDLVCEFENEAQLAYRFISVIGSLDGAGSSLYSGIIDTFDLTSLSNLCDFISYLKDNGVDEVMNIVRSKGIITGSVTLDKCSQILSKLIDEVDPVTFMVACNIGGISWNTLESIFTQYPTFLNDLNEDDKFDFNQKLHSIKGIGNKTINTLINAKDRVKKLYGIMNIKEFKKEDKPEVSFKVAITGALSMKRSDFDQLLKDKGIEQSSNFNEIKYLITNNPDSGSSKMKKAKDKGIEIISEEEFSKMYLK